MKIGMILDATFPPDPRVENEAISLIEAGNEVFLFCLHYGDQTQSEQIKGIQVKRYLSNKLEYKLSALVYSFPFYTHLMARKINHFLETCKIEAIHVHDIQIAAAVFKTIVKKPLPVVLDLHENRPEIMKFYRHLNKFPGNLFVWASLWKKKEEQFVSNASRVVVVTEEAKKDLLLRCKIASNNIVVVPNTVRASFYQDVQFNKTIFKKHQNHFVLLYIGDTGIRRGLQTVISSLLGLKKKISNIKLVILGKSSSDLILKRQVRSLGLENYVDFEGWKDPEVFPSYIEASSICISPLHRNVHHDTTYANKLFQYMSLGKPVLVSDATAQKNIVEKVSAGLVHKAQDSKDFGKKVVQLFSDSKQMMVFGENGKKFVRNEFSWEQTSKNLVSLYDTL